MQQDSFDLKEAVAVLERTPASLSSLLADLPERFVHAREGKGTWSPHEVIAHLIHADQANWLNRARHILAGEKGPFPPFDRTANFAESRDKGLSDLLAAFTAVRRESVATLVGLNLTREDLARTGQHPEFGEVTLGQLLATWVVHDMTHIAQIVRTLAKVYGEAVGPWRAYLSILKSR